MLNVSAAVSYFHPLIIFSEDIFSQSLSLVGSVQPILAILWWSPSYQLRQAGVANAFDVSKILL
jgi:hypothetical protein